VSEAVAVHGKRAAQFFGRQRCAMQSEAVTTLPRGETLGKDQGRFSGGFHTGVSTSMMTRWDRSP